MRQTKHLFLGGPLDQQWLDVPRLEAMVVAVECATGPTTARMVHYRREYVSLPGWVVPLRMFVAVGRHQIEQGDVLPGCVAGETLERSPAPGNWMGIDHHGAALHRAINARGFRP